MSIHTRTDAGLTLVELLVVLAVLGLLGALAGASLRSATSGWRILTAHDARQAGQREGERWLRRLLSEIVPRPVSPSDPTVRFSGQSDRIAFLAPLSDRHGSRDIVRYAVSLSDRRVTVSWQLDRDVVEHAPPAVLDGSLDGLQDPRLSYFGPAEGGGTEGAWWPSWNRRDRLPTLIRLRFALQDGPRELVVAPLLTTAAP